MEGKTKMTKLKRAWEWAKLHPGWVFFVLGTLAYGLSLLNGFVWDDEEQVVNNVAIQNLANIPRFFTQSTFNSGGAGGMSGMYFKPIMPIFFTFIYQVFGLNAWGYHLVQFLLHILTAYLLYKVFRYFVSENWSLLAGLLFLWHPGNVESVAYVSGLQDVLFMFFGLLAFWWVLRHKDMVSRDWGVLSIFLLLSIFSKETGALFFLTLVGYFWLFRRRDFQFYLLLFSVLVSFYAVLRYGLAGVGLNVNHLSPIMKASFGERLITMPKIIGYYLQLIIFPLNLAISQHWVVRQLSLGDFWRPLLVDLVFFCLILALNLKRKSKRLWFFSLLIIFGLGLHSQIIPLDMTVSERWLYFPLFGFLGYLAVYFEGKLSFEKVLPVFLLLLLIWGGKTILRVTNWRDGLTLFLHDEPLAKGNFDFENNVGVYLFRAGRRREAGKYYLRSTQIAPNWWTNWNNLGVTYELDRKPKLAKRAYLRAIKNGDYYLAYENYSALLIKQKEYRAAENFLGEQALLKFPYNEKLQKYYQYLLNRKNAR